MQIIKLDLSSYEIPQSIVAKQGDVGRKFQAKLTDSNREYLIPEGARLSVWYSGTSGAGNYSEIGQRSAFIVEGSTVTVELITQMLQNKGGGTLCLMLLGADGTQIAMWNIPYVVEPVPGLGSHAAKQYYSALSETVSDAARSAKAAQEAAQTAADTLKNRLPVGLYSHDTIIVNKDAGSKTFWEQIMGIFDAMPPGSVELVQAIVSAPYDSTDANEPGGGVYRVTLTKSADPFYGFVEAVTYNSTINSFYAPIVMTRTRYAGAWKNAQWPMKNIFNAVNSELIWSNASKTTAMAPQTITLPERAKDFDALLIMVNLDTSWYYSVPVLVRKEGTEGAAIAYFPGCSYDGKTWLSCWRYFFLGSDGVSLTISTGYRDGNASNSRAIPYKIYGIML